MQQRPLCTEKITSFSAALKQLEISSFPISDYSKRYLGYLITHASYFLSIYAQVLNKLLSNTQKDAGTLTLVDYGAGNGLLGMFAKYCGVHQVIVCDIDLDFINASRITAEKLNICIDDYVCGDINSLARATAGKNIDAIVGTDVIEHVYDLDHFFAAIRHMNEAMITVFTTASNPDNWFKVHNLKKLHLRDEFEGSAPTDSLLAGAVHHPAFIRTREKIIRENFNNLSEEKYLLLARHTRGLKETDIILASRNYLQTGILPALDLADTNTCEPYSGSWTERILPLDYFENLYHRNGFALTVTPGFYNGYIPGLKGFVNKFRNGIIKLTGKNTAPFITLTGVKPK